MTEIEFDREWQVGRLIHVYRYDLLDAGVISHDSAVRIPKIYDALPQHMRDMTVDQFIVAIQLLGVDLEGRGDD